MVAPVVFCARSRTKTSPVHKTGDPLHVPALKSPRTRFMLSLPPFPAPAWYDIMRNDVVVFVDGIVAVVATICLAMLAVPRAATVAPSIVTTCHDTVAALVAATRERVRVLVVAPAVTRHGAANVPRPPRNMNSSSLELAFMMSVCSPAITTKLLVQSTVPIFGAVAGVALPALKVEVPRTTLTPLSNSATDQPTEMPVVPAARPTSIVRVLLLSTQVARPLDQVKVYRDQQTTKALLASWSSSATVCAAVLVIAVVPEWTRFRIAASAADGPNQRRPSAAAIRTRGQRLVAPARRISFHGEGHIDPSGNSGAQTPCHRLVIPEGIDKK